MGQDKRLHAMTTEEAEEEYEFIDQFFPQGDKPLHPMMTEELLELRLEVGISSIGLMLSMRPEELLEFTSEQVAQAFVAQLDWADFSDEEIEERIAKMISLQEMMDEELLEEEGVRADEHEPVPEFLRETIEALASLQSVPDEERREQLRLIMLEVTKNYTEEFRIDAIFMQRKARKANKTYLEFRKILYGETWRCEGAWGATLEAWPPFVSEFDIGQYIVIDSATLKAWPPFISEKLHYVDKHATFTPDTLPEVMTEYKVDGVKRIWFWAAESNKNKSTPDFAFKIEPSGQGNYYIFSELYENPDRPGSFKPAAFFQCTLKE